MTAPTATTKAARPTLDSIPIRRPEPQQSTAGLLPRRRLRLPLGPRARGGPRLHRAHPPPQRGARAEAQHAGMARATLGRRGLPLLAQPQPRAADPLVEETENHLALLQLACGLIAFKKAHAYRLAHT